MPSCLTTLAITLSAVLLGGEPKPDTGPPAAAPGSPVRVLPADPDTLPGVTRPEQEASLGVPYDALISEVRVDEGQRVRAGEILIVLDDRVTRAALRVSEVEAAHTAAVDRARTLADRAAQALRRAERAHNSGASNPEQLAEYRKDHAVALADLRFAEEEHDKAKAQLEMTRAQYEEHLIRAPFDGVVVRVHAKPGEVVGPAAPIADLAALDLALVDLYLPSRTALALRKGDRIALHLAEPVDAVVAGRVRFADPRIDTVSRACRVVLELEAPRAAIPSGLLVFPAGRAPARDDHDLIAGLRESLRAEQNRAEAPEADTAQETASVETGS